MTPTAFDTEMKRAISVCKDRLMLAAVGRRLIEQALGLNAFAYIAGVNDWCKAMRALGDGREFNTPTARTIGEVPAGERAL